MSNNVSDADNDNSEFINIDELLKHITPTNQTNHTDHANYVNQENTLSEQMFDYAGITNLQIKEETNEEENIKHNELINTNQCKLYQIQGVCDEGVSMIRFVGYSDPQKNNHRPCHVLENFRFNKHNCQLVSYILSDIDIEHANETCELKMFSILIKKSKNAQVKYAITYSFYTFIHKKQKKHMKEFITKDMDINTNELDGFFCVKLLNNELGTNIMIETYKTYKGKKTLYDLILMLSHEKVLHIWK